MKNSKKNLAKFSFLIVCYDEVVFLKFFYHSKISSIFLQKYAIFSIKHAFYIRQKRLFSQKQKTYRLEVKLAKPDVRF